MGVIGDALTTNPMWQQDAYRMIQRRAKAAGIRTRIGNHSFRATGITAYLKNGGRLEIVQQMANHESSRTTGLYMIAEATRSRSTRSSAWEFEDRIFPSPPSVF
jgi:site-specific recombinase XerD